MYYSLDGILGHLTPDLAVIDCGGVGYACNITLNTYRELSGQNRIRLYTYLHVKEDALTLYGFWDEKEKTLFLQLISISGVGPKVALAILSTLLPDTLISAVLAGDHRQITKVPGVGPKLAQRICLELKDKLAKTGFSADEGSGPRPSILAETEEDAINALLALGYSRTEARAAVAKCSADNPEDMIRQALRQLSGTLK